MKAKAASIKNAKGNQGCEWRLCDFRGYTDYEYVRTKKAG
jgi:hypothetical protein